MFFALTSTSMPPSLARFAKLSLLLSTNTRLRISGAEAEEEQEFSREGGW